VFIWIKTLQQQKNKTKNKNTIKKVQRTYLSVVHHHVCLKKLLNHQFVIQYSVGRIQFTGEGKRAVALFAQIHEVFVSGKNHQFAHEHFEIVRRQPGGQILQMIWCQKNVNKERTQLRIADTGKYGTTGTKQKQTRKQQTIQKTTDNADCTWK